MIDAMVAAASEAIDARAAELKASLPERITAALVDAERAAELEASLVERITALVNGERPRRDAGWGAAPGDGY